MVIPCSTTKSDFYAQRFFSQIYKPKFVSCPRLLWLFYQGDLRIDFTNIDWDSIGTNDLNSWVSSLTSHILVGSEILNPNKTVTLSPQ
ncbi:hypothetical protein MAR_002574 [Mya arenaria]|uniref:Uncharacterized protein n=1 Tax=Mya arenaria TaxID=6604 RepID=A0ABY7GCS7_MYAAR|nr:hypothetical protein MAR_002574 [Mya arenaria]